MWWRHPLLVLVELVWFNGCCLYPHSHAHILHSYQPLWIIYSERSVGLTIYWKGALTGNHALTVFCVKQVCTQPPPVLSCTSHFRRPLAAPCMIKYKPYRSFMVMCHSAGKPLCFRRRRVPRETVGTSQAAKRPTCLSRNIFFPRHLVLIQISLNASEPRYRLKVRTAPRMRHYEWYLSLRRVIRRRLRIESSVFTPPLQTVELYFIFLFLTLPLWISTSLSSLIWFYYRLGSTAVIVLVPVEGRREVTAQITNKSIVYRAFGGQRAELIS